MIKSLEALQKIEKELCEYYGCDIAYYPDLFEMFSSIGKELQALEIIKKANTKKLLDFLYDNCEIDQEEHDLLKEVLL